MSEQPLYMIVEGLGDARSLVYSTWLRSYEHSSPMTKQVPRAVFFTEHHKVIDRIMARDPIVKMAVMPDDPSVVFGWAVVEKGPAYTVHYVYVKPDFRKYGIAKALLADIPRPFNYSHWTYILRDLEPKIPGSRFNPYEV